MQPGSSKQMWNACLNMHELLCYTVKHVSHMLIFAKPCMMGMLG